jgi:hypothetical protein
MSGFTRSRSVTASKPATSARPAVGRARPVSIRIVVVLPAPLCPSRPKTSPSATLKVIPSTARTVP